MAMSLSLDAQSASATSTASTDTETLEISNLTGYRAFRAGGFHFARDEYFAHLSWPAGPTSSRSTCSCAR